MKSPIILIMLLSAMLYSVIAEASKPTQSANEIADGFYQVTVDESGNTKTEFTPWDKVIKSSSAPEKRSILEKRREHCGPGSVSVNEADEANKCLVDGFPAGDQVFLNTHKWAYCVRGEVVSFVCPYTGGFKPKDAIKFTWNYVKKTCGGSILGYAQVSGGSGDWTAGYALKTDNFCTKEFKIGS